MRALLFLLLIVLVTTALAAGGADVRPAAQDDILSHATTFPNSSLPVYLAFQSALLASNIPGGAILVKGCSGQPEATVRPHGNTLREFLDSISGEDSDFKWILRDGVVNLEPVRGVPVMLRTHLKIYTSSTLTDASSVVTALSSSAEVTSAAASQGLTHNVSGSALSGVGPGPTPQKKPLNIRLQNVTLLEALNAVAQANKRGVWTYQETRCGSQHQFDLTFSQ